MSHASNDEKDGKQPPSKRQRFLPAGENALSGHDKSFVASLSTSVDSGLVSTDLQDTNSCSLVESALRVPTSILFRQVGGDKTGEGVANASKTKRRLRPLLSRQEMEQFLRLALLAQEIDVLVDLSETALSRRQFAKRFRRDILMQRDTSNHNLWKNPWLATMGPILDVLEQRQSNPPIKCHLNKFVSKQEDFLHHIHNELTRLYQELQACGIFELERSAEQNRSLVASLTDILGYNYNDNDDDSQADDSQRTAAVRKLIKEKQSLSKLQDFLAHRVRSLLVVLCHFQTTPSSESNNSTCANEKLKNDTDSENNRKRILQSAIPSVTSTDVHNDDVDKTKSTLSMKKESNKEDNDNENKAINNDQSSILSMEEILIPLEVVCSSLFDHHADRKIPTRMASHQNEEDSIGKEYCSKSENENSSGCADDFQEKKKQQIEHHEADSGSLLLNAMTTKSNMIIENDSKLDSLIDDSNPVAMSTERASDKIDKASTNHMVQAGKLKLDCMTQEKAANGKNGVKCFDQKSTVAPEASQRTVEAGITMMKLAKDMEILPTAHEETTIERGNVFDRKNKPESKGTTETKQYSCDDNDSFVDDPPSVGEERYGENTNKTLSADYKNSTKNTVGIFDVVDVLTPHSQSQ